MNKQLHGHTIIELRDAKTGEIKQRVEKDNLITNATANYIEKFSRMLSISTLNSAWLPAKDKLFKGLFLFDNYLTENADNYVFPSMAVAGLTGHAGATVSDGNLNMRGDFNVEESGAISNGYKYVWDFGTNDANGQIACIALTNDIAGYNGIYIDLYNSYASGRGGTGSTRASYKGLGTDPGIDVGYANMQYLTEIVEVSDGVVIVCIQKNSATNINIKKWKLCTNKVTLDNTLNTVDLLSEENVTITDTVLTQMNGDVRILDGGDGYYYLISAYGSQTIEGEAYRPIRIAKLNKSTYEYTPAELSYCPFYMEDNGVNYTWINITNSVPYAVIRNGYIYCMTESTTDWCVGKISLTNTEDCELLTATKERVSAASQGTTPMLIYKMYNGDIYTLKHLIDTSDGVINRDGYGDGTENHGSRKVFCSKHYYIDYYRIAGYSASYSVRIYPVMWYLATINNLDSIVTKTAALTMKITYTLTYA